MLLESRDAIKARRFLRAVENCRPQPKGERDANKIPSDELPLPAFQVFAHAVSFLPYEGDC